MVQCVAVEIPPLPCHVHTEKKQLLFNTSDGEACWSANEIDMTSCLGKHLNKRHLKTHYFTSP